MSAYFVLFSFSAHHQHFKKRYTHSILNIMVHWDTHWRRIPKYLKKILCKNMVWLTFYKMWWSKFKVIWINNEIKRLNYFCCYFVHSYFALFWILFCRHFTFQRLLYSPSWDWQLNGLNDQSSILWIEALTMSC